VLIASRWSPLSEVDRDSLTADVVGERVEVSALKYDRNQIDTRVYVLIQENDERAKCKAMKVEMLEQCNSRGNNLTVRMSSAARNHRR
jgi:hypothetical protein